MAVAVDLVWDAENGADAAAMTTTIMDAGTHLSGAIGAWGVVGASPNFAVSVSGQKGHGTRAFSVSGTPYTDSAGTRGMRQDHSAQGGIAKYFQFVKSVGTAKVSASVWFNTGIAYQGFESYTVFGLIDGGFTGGAMFNLQTFGAGSHETYIENVSSATLQGPSLSLNTWYLSSLLYDKANNLGKLAIFDTSYAQVGSTIQLALTSGTPADCTQYRVGSFGGNFPSHPVFSYYDDLAVDASGVTFPLLPTASAAGGQILRPFSFNWWNK
jgi:hypothetical protein